MNKNIYLYPAALAVIFMSSLLIIVSPIGNNKTIIPVPTPTPTPTILPIDYICPDTEWINCMPGPGPTKAECQPDFLNWAGNNCPNFKGGAF